jgi:ACS family tartrate transporter-like MFS transporter
LERVIDYNLESAVITRLMWRLMPFLFLLYIVAYLDRINVGFAVLQMRERLHLTDRVYGRAAGMFFAGYFFFQVPSNLVLQKVGVRRWISGLMVVWGLVSCSMIFIRGPVSFYVLRFLLGAAEAGFFPGMILYLKHWFPSRARARAVAWFMTSNALAGILGSPLSGALLGLRGGGLAGWQWLFVMEGAPAILLGFVVLWVLVEHPHQATWLSPEHRDWLLERLEQEDLSNMPMKSESLRAVFTSGSVWILSMVYFGIPAGMYGVTLWLPSVIRSLLRLSDLRIGVVSVIPYVLTAIVMVLVARHSDQHDERRWHTALPALLGAGALAGAAYSKGPFLVVAGMVLGMIGAQSMVGPFWAMATAKTSGAAAPAIAVINSVGNLGGYFGPYIIGLARSAEGDFRGGLLAIGVVLAVSGVLALAVGRPAEGPPLPTTVESAR